MSNKTFYIIFVILIIVSIVGLSSYLPARFDAALKIKVANFPMQIGEWSATDIPLSEKDYQILETRNLFVRDYKNSKGESVYLYIVYSEDNRKVSHPPEVCILGGGASVTDKKQVQITKAIKANTLIVEKGDTQDMFVYWYKAGNFYTDKYLSQQLRIVLKRTFGKRTSGALIRASTNIKEGNQGQALNLLKSFCLLIEPLLNKYIP